MANINNVKSKSLAKLEHTHFWRPERIRRQKWPDSLMRFLSTKGHTLTRLCPTRKRRPLHLNACRCIRSRSERSAGKRC